MSVSAQPKAAASSFPSKDARGAGNFQRPQHYLYQKTSDAAMFFAHIFSSRQSLSAADSKEGAICQYLSM